jgi:hypothetical protein
MKHQPFETWLFEREELLEDQEDLLQEHLDACERCSAFAAAHNTIEWQMRKAPTIAPAPGFTYRWRFRLAEQRRRTRNRRLLVIGIFMLLGLAALAVLFWANALAVIKSNAPAILAWVGDAINVIAHLNLVREILGVVLDSFLSDVPMVFRVSLPVVLAGLSVLWIASLYRLGYINVRRE